MVSEGFVSSFGSVVTSPVTGVVVPVPTEASCAIEETEQKNTAKSVEKNLLKIV